MGNKSKSPLRYSSIEPGTRPEDLEPKSVSVSVPTAIPTEGKVLRDLGFVSLFGGTQRERDRDRIKLGKLLRSKGGAKAVFENLISNPIQLDYTEAPAQRLEQVTEYGDPLVAAGGYYPEARKPEDMWAGKLRAKITMDPRVLRKVSEDARADYKEGLLAHELGHFLDNLLGYNQYSGSDSPGHFNGFNDYEFEPSLYQYLKSLDPKVR